MLPLWQVGYGVETREGLDAGKKAREGEGQRAKGSGADQGEGEDEAGPREAKAR